jgi:hypothetical protein
MPVREMDEKLILEAKVLKRQYPDRFGFNLLKMKLYLCTRVTNELLEFMKSNGKEDKDAEENA